MSAIDTTMTVSGECGSYHDNLAMFEQAMGHFAQGRRVEARALCDRLLLHICVRKDGKSERWLLPRIMEELRLL